MAMTSLFYGQKNTWVYISRKSLYSLGNSIVLEILTLVS